MGQAIWACFRVVFGYTIIDPIVVILGTLLAAYYLIRMPIRLLAFLPAALSVYFFIPTFTFITLWQIVPSLIIIWLIIGQRLALSRPINMLMVFAILAIAWALSIALTLGEDPTRAILRLVYYAGALGVAIFCYVMGRSPKAYRLFLRGLVATGIIFAFYGLYQVAAATTGLPYRGIVRGIAFAQAAYESGVFRINSFASEPKRLGYILFVCGLACWFHKPDNKNTKIRLQFSSICIFGVSFFTISASYYIAVLGTIAGSLVLFDTKVNKLFYYLGAAGVISLIAFSDSDIWGALELGLNRRLVEIEVGADGQRVYRQEFFAWKFVDSHPVDTLLGTGLGQYYSRLHFEYGIGAGMTPRGELFPLNSNALELVLEFGAIFTLVFYLGLAKLIWRLRNAKEHFLSISVMFLAIHSFTVVTFLFIAMFSGIGLGRLQYARSRQIEKNRPPPRTRLA